MKKQIVVIPVIVSLVTLFTGHVHSQGKNEPAAMDAGRSLEQLKSELKDNLTTNLLPYWSARMVDSKNGGFFGRIDINDIIYPDEDKGGILNARILWTYSAAYRVMKDTAYLRFAARARDYILANFIDRQSGGAFRSVKAGGEPSDSRKQTYTEAFFIYGLSEYNRITGDREALESARQIYELLEKYARDRESDGYFEVFTRDWKRDRSMLIGEKTINDEKTMNTHLHLLEAYANLFRVWPDERVKESLRNLVEIFLDRIIDKRTSHLICFMDRHWNGTSEIDSYGHDIEASWLLCEAAAVIGDPGLTARVREASIRIADAATEGLQADGSMIDEKDTSTGMVSKGRSWWPQVETVVGYVNAWELTGKMKYLGYAVSNWSYTKSHFVDPKNGGWYSSLSDHGLPERGDKGGFWVCPYHNGRMCLEIIVRASR